jgi:hypothetical protein
MFSQVLADPHRLSVFVIVSPNFATPTGRLASHDEEPMKCE